MKVAIKKRFLLFLGFLIVSLVWFSVATALAQAKRFHFKYGATSVRSGLYANTVAKAAIINKAYPGEIVVTVVETGGYKENLQRLRRGTVHAGASSSGTAAASFLGTLDWEGKPDKNLRAMWGGYFTSIHILCSRKSGITTLEGVAGRSFATNPGLTSTWHIEYFLRALDIKPSYRAMSMGASIDAMKAGVVDCWFKAGFKDASVLDVESAIDINIIPIRPEHLARADKLQPGLHRGMTIPADLFRAVKSEQLSYAYVITDFVRKDVPEEVVYKMVKAIWENRKHLVDSLLTLKEGNFDDMVVNAAKYGLKVPFHAGAVRFFREIGQTIPPELIPPEAKK